MPDLPRGTVTFLFTDIEGSTRLWERDRAAIHAVVERHLALLREAVAAHRGVLYKTVGDGTQAAFPAAADALRAALAAQRTLLSEPWPEVAGSLRVRMALHAGQAEPRDNDYLAAPLNRLARLLDIAHGGQILLTDAVAQLVQDDLPPGASLSDLGEVPLRDLERAERVFSLAHPDLPADLPAAAPAVERLRGFPPTLSPFIGREALIAAVSDLLHTPDIRLLTLTGPGGTGKTRLALRVGEELAGAFPNGVVFVDLASLRDPALVLSAVATALGLREGGGRSLDDIVYGYLREQRLLLILDNFEHLLSAAPAVTALVAAGSGVKALVTSREPLRIRGEHEYPVPTLTLPVVTETGDLADLEANEAIAFFVDRARAVRPDFALNAERATVVAEICRRLDGLPLAIALAAARVKVLPPAALLARLERRLPLLTSGERDAPERQRTLRDAIAWSHDLLSPAEQTLFRRLAVFVGGWTLEAAEDVGGRGGRGGQRGEEHETAAPLSPLSAASPPLPPPPPSVLDLLASLVDKSLVELDERETQPRYRMLETIREFAVERLAANPDEESAVRQAHAEFFADLALTAQKLGIASGTVASFSMIRADEDNLRAMLAYLLDTGGEETVLRVAGGSLSEYWTLAGGRFDEGLGWLERALRQGRDASVDARAWAQYGVAIMALHRGDLATARAAATQALHLGRSATDPVLKAYGPFTLSLVEGTEGRPEVAAILAAEAVSAARASGDPETTAWPLLVLGIAQFLSGAYDDASSSLEEALTLYRGIDAITGAADVMSRLADLAYVRGDRSRAAQLHHDSLHLRHEAGFTYNVYGELIGLAKIAVDLGMWESAALLLGGESVSRTQSGYEGFWDTPAIRERVRTAVSDKLGAERFQQAWDRGRALPHDALVAEALAIAKALETQ